MLKECSICSDRPEENECDPNEVSDDDGITFTEEDDDNLETCVIDMDTMLDDYELIIPQLDEPLIPQELHLHLEKVKFQSVCSKMRMLNIWHFPLFFVGRRDQIIVIEFIKFITVTYTSMN